MRFKAAIHNTSTFAKFTASLASLGHVAWVRLNDSEVRFTIIPEQGTQVWAVLAIDSVFETYLIQSAADLNSINLEVPLQPLVRALRSTAQATSASIRLTKREGIPALCITIVTSFVPSAHGNSRATTTATNAHDPDDFNAVEPAAGTSHSRERDTLITQDIPVRVLSSESVAGLHEPRCPEPDVHIVLPPLIQLKNVSDSFTKLGLTTSVGSKRSSAGPKLEMSATMRGSLRLSLENDSLRIASTWTGLSNPELDPLQIEGGEAGIRMHPSTRMRSLEGEESWARVCIDGKDWGKVLSVGRLGGRVIACFCHHHALILYVYLANDDQSGDESVLTYYITSYSA